MCTGWHTMSGNFGKKGAYNIARYASQNGKLIVELLEAISHIEMLSTYEAKDMVSKGNASADLAAKQAKSQEIANCSSKRK